MNKSNSARTFVFYLKERPKSETKFLSSEDVYERMKPLVQADQESVWVIGFNSRHMEIYQDCLFIGGLNQCIIDHRLLFKRLLTIGATAFILIHNHPSGSSCPSADDFSTTNKIQDSARILGLNFLDHIIISDDGYFSLMGISITGSPRKEKKNGTTKGRIKRTRKGA